MLHGPRRRETQLRLLHTDQLSQTQRWRITWTLYQIIQSHKNTQPDATHKVHNQCTHTHDHIIFIDKLRIKGEKKQPVPVPLDRLLCLKDRSILMIHGVTKRKSLLWAHSSPAVWDDYGRFGYICKQRKMPFHDICSCLLMDRFYRDGPLWEANVLRPSSFVFGLSPTG